MDFLLIGNYGNFNIGDELLLKGAIREIIDEFEPDCKFYIPTRNVGFRETYHKEISELLLPVSISNLPSLWKSFRKSRAIIIGGGGIWSRYTGSFAHLIPFVGLFGKLFGKKLHFKSIGLYSTASRFDRLFVNLSIMAADSCTVRDAESFCQLWNRNKRNAKQVEDLSIPLLRHYESSKGDIPRIPEYEELELAKHDGKLIVGVAIKPTLDSNTNSKIIKEFAQAFNSLNTAYGSDMQIVLFPFAKTISDIEDDARMAEGFVRELSRKDNVTIISHTNPVAWFYAIKDLTDIFVGMRYHSIILAHEANKPLLCIAYENKITEYLNGKSGISGIMMPSEVSSTAIYKFVEENLLRSRIYHD